MKYNTGEIAISKTCKNFNITLKNTGTLPKTAMGHDLVIAKAADVDAIVSDGASAGPEKHFLKSRRHPRNRPYSTDWARRRGQYQYRSGQTFGRRLRIFLYLSRPSSQYARQNQAGRLASTVIKIASVGHKATAACCSFQTGI